MHPRTIVLTGVAITPAKQSAKLKPDPKPQDEAVVEEALELEAEAEAEAAPPKRQSLFDKVRAMKRPQKILFALKANREGRILLIKSNDPQVYHFLVKNPRMTTDEIIALTKSALLQPVTLELIARNREWMKGQRVRFNIVLNPKTPLPLCLNTLGYLDSFNIKQVARNPYVRSAIRRIALRKLQQGD